MQRVSLFIAPCQKTAKLLENAAFRNLLHHTVFPVQGLDVVNTFPCKMMREKKRTVASVKVFWRAVFYIPTFQIPNPLLIAVAFWHAQAAMREASEQNRFR